MSDSNKDLVFRAWKAFADKNATKIAAFFSDDAELIAPPGNATAVALAMTDQTRAARK